MTGLSSNLHRAVIWDMDGTLVDTADFHFQAWSKLAARHGFPFSREDFEATFGRRNPEIIHQLLGSTLTREQVDQLGDEKEEIYRQLARGGVRTLPGAANLLMELHAAGVLQAIGSSAPRKNLDLILEITNTKSYFSAVAAMEDTSRGKPDPEVFLCAASRLGVPPSRCVVIEDAPAGIEAARAAGMRSIGVTFVGHHKPQSLRQAGANLVVQSFEHLTGDRVLELLQVQ